ncbi:hypothetical protein [Vulcanococcus limneticus]|uniref:hypothetical protein n=1 Tax=Vulcanococcus limneticus TaxID=2170428 RepID=UPI00398BDB70
MQSRPPRPQAARRLLAIRNGLISLALGALLALALLVHAEQARRQGDAELARDSLRMLWSPAVFAGVGVLFLLRSIGPPYRLPGAMPRQLRWRRPAPVRSARPQAQVSAAQARSSAAAAAPPPTPAPSPPAPAAPPGGDRYLQACQELGVSPGAEWVVVRSTWRRQLQHWHPDNGGDPEQWNRKKAAYALLEAWEQFRA